MSCSLSACACGAQNTLSFLPVDESLLLSVRLRWTFPPACRGKGLLMDLSPCLSMKKTYHGVGMRLR